jgi:glycosyltransferase involved in cell wall biosynthesis
MKVLITSPSLDEQKNVSGISTMISSIIDGVNCEFVHFSAGRRDGAGFDLSWLRTQALLPFVFRRAISANKPDVIHLNTSFEPRSIVRDLVLAKAGRQRPVVLHVHGGRFVMADFENSALASLADRLLRTVSRVIVLSGPEAENILKRTPGLDISVVPNAVSSERFSYAERSWGEKTIVYLGRLDEAKGLSEMVESCRQLTAQGFKFNFACYGTGRDQDEFIRRMTSVLGDRFHFGGVIRGVEKVEALRSADVFLMPSRYEGLPLALLEAMACGCVPVVSDRGSIPTVVDDGRNGFLVDPGDITQIVGKLKFLLSEGEPGWDLLRRAARQTIIDGYGLSQYSAKLETIYTEVCHTFSGTVGHANR